MIENASGIILRTRPLTETSLIVHWLTADLGRFATVAKGARRPNSPFRGKLDLFYSAEFAFLRSRRSELHTLREVKLLDPRPRLRMDVTALHRACYATALIEQTTEIETPLEDIYRLFSRFLSILAASETSPPVVFGFELQFLRELGIEPPLDQTALSTAATERVRKMLNEELESLTQLCLQAGEMRELSQFLHGFLIYHLGKIPRSRGAALTE